MKILYVIPARKGSKGVPGKNSRMLAGKPLVQFSIEMALSLASEKDICVTTDSEEIIGIAEKCGVSVPFVRPAELSNDNANSREVILHALEYYRKIDIHYDTVVLLQPTSPFRQKSDILSMISQFDKETDLVVSVRTTHDNPYFSLFEESASGFLQPVIRSSYTRRQDCPTVYAFNGSVYVIRVSALISAPISQFSRTKKFVMNDISSIDIDNPFDWHVAEMILEKNLFTT